MIPPDEARASARRRRGILLGGIGLVLLFAPAIAVVLLPAGLAPIAVALMAVGIILLAVGYVTLPKRM